MSITALAIGVGIGLLHWLIFYLAINQLFTHKEMLSKRGIASMFAFLRLLVTVGLGVLVIAKLKFPATEVAVGVLLGFNACRIPFIIRSNRASQRLRSTDNADSKT